MEEPIWMFIGVVSIMIAVGIIINIVSLNNHNVQKELFDNNLEKLKIQCDFICSSATGNRQFVTIDFLPESKIYTNEDKICIEFKDKISCERCSCEVEEFELNLNTSLAKEFDKLRYNCYFEKLKDDVLFECRG